MELTLISFSNTGRSGNCWCSSWSCKLEKGVWQLGRGERQSLSCAGRKPKFLEETIKEETNTDRKGRGEQKACVCLCDIPLVAQVCFPVSYCEPEITLPPAAAERHFCLPWACRASSPPALLARCGTGWGAGQDVHTSVSGFVLPLCEVCFCFSADIKQLFNKVWYKMQIPGFIWNTQKSYSHSQMFRKYRGAKRKAIVNVHMLQLHRWDTTSMVQSPGFFLCCPDSSQDFRLGSFLFFMSCVSWYSYLPFEVFSQVCNCSL